MGRSKSETDIWDTPYKEETSENTTKTTKNLDKKFFASKNTIKHYLKLFF